MSGGGSIPRTCECLAPQRGEADAKEEGLPLNRTGVPLEPVRHKDFILMVLVAVGQDIGALNYLVRVAKDIIH